MATGEEVATERTPLVPTQDEPATPSSISRRRGVIICFSIWLLIFILTCNVSMISTIVSSIATDLDAPRYVSWFTSAYLIAVTSLTPVAGRLSQIFTARYYLFGSVIIQAIGLLVTSQARSLAIFLLGRVLTGIGSSAVTPVAFILVTDLGSSRRRGLLFGCVNTAYTSGVASGAIIAGALDDVIGWRATFWLQIPLTLTGGIIALLSLPNSTASSMSRRDETLLEKLSRIDYLGILTLISSVVLLLYSLSSATILITPILLSLAGLMLFILIEMHWARDPIVPPSVLKSRGNVLTGLATIGIMTARWSILFYTPIYAMSVRGWSKATAGLMLIPTNFGFALGGMLVGWLHIRRAGSFWLSCILVYFLFAAAIFIISQISLPDSNIFGYVLALFVNGFITGALLNYTLAHVLHLTPPPTHVVVIPLNAMFRGLSGSFGSSIAGGIFLRSLYGSLNRGLSNEHIPNKNELIRKLLGTPQLVQELTGVEHDIALQSYITAFRNLFTAGSGLALIMMIFQAGTGWTAPKAVVEDSSSDEQEDEDDIEEDLSRVETREPIAT